MEKTLNPNKGIDTHQLKLLLTMKLIILLVFINVIQVTANVFSQTTKLNLTASSVSYKEVFKAIESQSKCRFFYNNELINLNEKIDVQFKDATIDEVLSKILANKDLKYQLLDNNLIVLTPAPALKQQFKVSGRVTSGAKGETVPGVNIIIKGTTIGTTTDADGKYSIEMPDGNATLLFSFIGYVSQEMALNGRSSVDVILAEDVKALEEIVVVGYGSIKKSDLTGSVSSIKADDIKGVAITSLDQSIQGRAAGVQVTQASSAPGGAVNIRIRGGNSLSSSNEPLYVIDGYAITGGASASSSNGIIGQSPLTSLNPNDIESMEILKDASSTAIYGARGANGVVLITTKRGKAGKTTINYDVYYGWQKIAKKLDMINGEEFITLANEAYINSGDTLSLFGKYPGLPAPGTIGKGYDYQDAIFRVAPMQSHQLTISGGTEITKFMVSAGYFDQTGIVIGSDFKRPSFRTNIDTKLNKWLTVGTSLTASQAVSNVGQSEGDGGNSSGTVNGAITMPPTVPIYKNDGTFTLSNNVPGGATIGNPVATAHLVTDKQALLRLLGNAYATIALTKNLSFRTTFGTDMSNANRNTYYPTQTLIGSIANGKATQSKNISTSYQNENILTFDKTFKKHSLNIVGGYSYQWYISEEGSTSVSNFPSDLFHADKLDAGTNFLPPTSAKRKNQLASWLGRVNYGFNDRYLLSLAGRADGSSKFGANNRWAFFPSVALGWRVTEESFMKSLTTISNLKLRGSYGLTGNQNIPEYSSQEIMRSQNYDFGGSLVNGVASLTMPNKDLKWETTAVTDVGFDLGLIKNHVNLTADYYYKKTKDLLWNLSIPASNGFNTKFMNIGTLENKGIELGLSTNFDIGAFNWTSDINWSANRNKVLDLGGTAPAYQGQLSVNLKTKGSWLEVGQPVGIWYLYKYNGVFHTPDELANEAHFSSDKVGYPKFVDQNGDGKIDQTYDRTVVGNPNPKFIYSWSNSFKYKGLDLSIFMQGVYGADILNLSRAEYDVVGPWGAQRRLVLDRWTPTNYMSDVPSAQKVPNANLLQSSWLIEDGTFLKIKTITLGYTLKAKKYVQSVRVYVTGQNLFTFTKYSGFDPEVNSSGTQNLNLGVDYNAYPTAKVFMIGCNVGF